MSISEQTLEHVATTLPQAMSEEEFEAFFGDEDVRAEWVNGEVILPMAASLRHSELGTWLAALLLFFVSRLNLGRVYNSEIEIRVPGLRRVPDITFISHERAHIAQPTYVTGAPDLIMEIVSADSVERDWHDKRVEYERIGVREYWVIDPQNRRVRAYQLTSEGYVAIAEQAGKIHSQVLQGFWIRPSDLWQEPLPSTLKVLQELGVIS
jgi:Uma2 family endonuclease